MVQCRNGDHDATTYYEAIITSPGETNHADGYACDDHGPTWKSIQDSLPEGSEVLAFRMKGLADTGAWKKGEVLDEYDPTHAGWGDDA